MTSPSQQDDQFEAFTQLQPFHDAPHSIDLRRRARKANKKPEASAGPSKTMTEFSQSQLQAVLSPYETLATVVENPSARALNALETKNSSKTDKTF